jgi:diguanylate cyclase (GGDEF)-like protein/PAS domain S-box-containing protein
MAKMPQEKPEPPEGSPPTGTGAFAPGNGVQAGDEAFCPAALRGISQRKMKDRWIESLSANLHGMLFQVRRAPSGKDLIACIGGTLASYFGFSPDNAPVDRDAFFRSVSPGDLPGVVRSFDEAMEKKSTWRCEFRLEIPERRRFFVEGTASPTEEPDGTLLWFGYLADVTERKELEEQLKDQLESYRSRSSPLFLSPLSSRTASPGFSGQRGIRRLREHDQEGYPGKGPYEVFSPDLAELVFREDREILRTGETKMDLERRVTDGHGRLMWLKSYKGPIRNSRGEIVGIVGGNMDISAVKDAEEALRESEARWKFALEGSGAGVWDLDVRTGDIFFSKQWKALLGYEDHEVRNSLEEWKRLIHPDDAEGTFRQIELTHEKNLDVCTAEFRMKRKNGEWAWILGMGKVVERDGDGKPLRVIGTHTDITERKNAEKIIFHQATHDALTDLANRSLFNDRLEMAMAEARRCGKKIGVTFLDLDNFKKVNDALGHSAGDMLLVSAAERMRRTLRDTDTLARIGGDEFAFLFPMVEDRLEVEAVAARILETLSAPFIIEGREFTISGSMGICLFPEDGGDAQTLMKRADMAMYEAKRAGKNTWRHWAGLPCSVNG